MPAIQHMLHMDEVLGKEIENYRSKQVSKEMWSMRMGAEAQHERKVFMMTTQASIQHHVVSMLATNIVSLANALLNKYGIYAQLVFSTGTLPNFTKKEHMKLHNTILIPTALKLTATTTKAMS